MLRKTEIVEDLKNRFNKMLSGLDKCKCENNLNHGLYFIFEKLADQQIEIEKLKIGLKEEIARNTEISTGGFTSANHSGTRGIK